MVYIKLVIIDEEIKSTIDKVVREDVCARASVYWLTPPFREVYRTDEGGGGGGRLGVRCSKFTR